MNPARTPHSLSLFLRLHSTHAGNSYRASALSRCPSTALHPFPPSRPPPQPAQAAGLALPGSDLDLVVLGVTPNMARAAEGLSGAARSEAAYLLEALARRMGAQGLTRSHKVIRAKVGAGTEGQSRDRTTLGGVGGQKGVAL